KYVIIETDWITGFTYGTLFSLVFVMLVPLIPKYRRIIGTEFSSYRQGCKLLIASEFLTFGANAIYIYAMSLTAVSLVNAIDSFQPFFVLLYAFVVAKYIPEFFKENITPANILKKFLFFGCMVLGVLLVV
ncbi:MAG: hypothetical protein COU33_03375, partial [Candidatus Magasanikbacteria bacterium CG10_big_fil_rev_8_21_14_0_10_43_6]